MYGKKFFYLLQKKNFRAKIGAPPSPKKAKKLASRGEFFGFDLPYLPYQS